MCIFCMIANGEIPSNKIYEDESVIAFLDINPLLMDIRLLSQKNTVILF